MTTIIKIASPLILRGMALLTIGIAAFTLTLTKVSAYLADTYCLIEKDDGDERLGQ